MSRLHDLPTPRPETELIEERRRFLGSCGRFAVVTPPTITLLLSTSLNSPALAKSGRPDAHGNNVCGNSGGDEIPTARTTTIAEKPDQPLPRLKHLTERMRRGRESFRANHPCGK